MVSMKQVLQASIKEIKKNMSEATDIRLEEFEKNSNIISISYLYPIQSKLLGTALLGVGNYERLYKSITFNKDTGEILGMKNYKYE